MKSSSYSVGIISVLAAVILWLIATWLEGDERWELPARIDAIDNSKTAPRSDSPVDSSSNNLSCGDAEAVLTDRVGASRYCASDDQCTLFDYGYPIQCMTSVAKLEISALRLEYRRYAQSCAHRVYYDCPTGGMKRVAVCRSNRCEVELRTNDPLQDRTREHLGVEDQ